jgi:glutamyl-tRNA synthetase
LEIFTLKDLISKFSLNKINKGNPQVTIHKLDWVNTKFIQKMIEEDIENVINLVEPQINDLSFSREYLINVLICVKERFQNINKFKDHFIYFFIDDFPIDREFLLSIENIADYQNLKIHLVTKLTGLESFDSKSISALLKDFSQTSNFKFKDCITLLRFFITGSKIGPGVTDIMQTLGKEKCLLRLNKSFS